MSVTAKELAKQLGLSEAAVSLALNHKPGVSTATQKRVLAAAEKAGFDFSKLKQAEPVRNSGSMYFVIFKKHGAVVADTPFFEQLTEGVGEACRALSYYLTIRYLHEGEASPALLADWKQAGCRGFILLGTEMQPHDIQPFLNTGLPVVLLDNYFEELDIDCVLINNIKGAYLATNHLIQRRGTQPGYLHSAYSINNFEERADGFYKATRKNGMSTSRSVVYRLTPSVEGAYADMTELLTQKEPMADCYFADNDLIAAGAVRAFKDAGYQIPQDIAVIGFDDMSICTFVEPPLSTIHVPKHYMGHVAVQRLHELICSPDSRPMKIEISTTLIKRKSC